VHPWLYFFSCAPWLCAGYIGDLKLVQIHPDVDHVLSQSRKTGKIASRDVARSRINWISACQHRAG
jgi:hypothetical protein